MQHTVCMPRRTTLPDTLWKKVFWPIVKTMCNRYGESERRLAIRWGIVDGTFNRLVNDMPKNPDPETCELVDTGLGAEPGWTQILWALTHGKPSLDMRAQIYQHLKRAGFEGIAEQAFPGVAFPNPATVGVEVPGGTASTVNTDGRILPIVQMIPVIANVEAGDPATWHDTYEIGDAMEWLECPHEINDKNAFGLVIHGDSMAPKLVDGDRVIVSPRAHYHRNDIVVFKVNDSDVSCKLYDKTDGTYIFRPINSDHDIQIVPVKEVNWIYKVVQLVRKL